MIEPILQELAERFGTDTLAIIIISGYLLFFLIFFSRDETKGKIWSKFQWGDRIFLGIIFGTFFWFFFILPLSVYGERFYRILYGLRIFNSVDPLMSQFILVTTYAYTFSLIFMLRRNAFLFSKKGADNIVNFIKDVFSGYLYISITLFIVEFLIYIISKNAYNLYPSIYNFWLLETVFNFFQTAAIMAGILIILLSINYLEYDVKINFIHYLYEFQINISNFYLRKIFKLKHWIILWILVTPTLAYPIIIIDNEIALFKPKYEIVSIKTSGPYNLYRKPNSDISYFTINVWEEIEIKPPFFNKTRYLKIINPSNLTSVFEFPESAWPNMYNKLIKFDILKKENILKFTFEPEVNTGKIYDIELYYLNQIIPKISFTEKISNVTYLGNGTFTVSYYIVIRNNTTDTIHVYQTFAAFQLPRRIIFNKTLEYHENGVLKFYPDFKYHIIDDWFYPTLRVGPYQKTEFRFNITGQS